MNGVSGVRRLASQFMIAPLEGSQYAPLIKPKTTDQYLYQAQRVYLSLDVAQQEF
jgi:hypothetical protein